MADYKDFCLMLVDDESAVLSALKRLLRRLGCQVITCNSGREALETLQDTRVDLLISDMRMPDMAGEALLEQVAETYPDIERIAISGYADVNSTIDAINRGRVSRFLLKPWDDEELLALVGKTLDTLYLKQENLRLQRETEEKNLALKELNQQLEAKVQQRTQQLTRANKKLTENYRMVVRMFSVLIGRRLGIKASAENLQLNRILLQVAARAGLEGQELKQLFYAWQLRQIGKLSFPDELIRKPYLQLSVEQQRLFQTHPVMAQAACLMVQPLYPAGKIILQHKEYLDGSGYPRGIKAQDIKYRAQILAVLNDYVELIRGVYSERQHSTDEALKYLSETAAERYNQAIVEILREVIGALSKDGEVLSDKILFSDQLRPGMVLSRDLISADGILLLGAEQRLDATAIERVRDLEFNLEEQFKIYVSQ
ncbi:HD domain-containing phosphohydrolase [Neptuniibacter halophilus]|uniref:HD domain-containing phosphohydrolase n=1 Tax=Neptuniibacter halophilus TaxID=651666 RepID=UPI0025739258|nr:HD domain-containing phosphohydrolase [Neptuniibacter halophilus]